MKLTFPHLPIHLILKQIQNHLRTRSPKRSPSTKQKRKQGKRCEVCTESSKNSSDTVVSLFMDCKSKMRLPEHLTNADIKQKDPLSKQKHVVPFPNKFLRSSLSFQSITKVTQLQRSLLFKRDAAGDSHYHGSLQMPCLSRCCVMQCCILTNA